MARVTAKWGSGLRITAFRWGSSVVSHYMEILKNPRPTDTSTKPTVFPLSLHLSLVPPPQVQALSLGLCIQAVGGWSLSLPICRNPSIIPVVLSLQLSESPAQPLLSLLWKAFVV